MRIEDFETEKWMNLYERQAKYNLTDTSSDAWTVQELLALEPDALQDLPLDYGWITGDPRLRKEILNLYQNQDESTLTLSCGALQGNEMVMASLLKPGDEVITFTPGYQQYTSFPEWLGCKAVEVPFDEPDWTLDLQKVEAAITPKTKMIAFANPSNPTGTWLDGEKMKELADLCRKYDLWLLCDEVYRDDANDMPSASDLYEKGIATGSLSKMYGLAGLRTGWIKGAAEVIEAVDTLRDYTIISTGPMTERLSAVALKHKEQLLARPQRVLAENKAAICEWLERTPYYQVVLPERGSVCFLKLPAGIESKAFARELLEKTGIFFVPGACFGKEGYLRFGLGKTHEDLPSVLDLLDSFTRDYLKKADRSFGQIRGEI